MVISNMYRKIGRIFNYNKTGSIEVESYNPDGDVVISSNHCNGRVSLHVEPTEVQKLIHLLKIGIRRGRGKKPVNYNTYPVYSTGIYGYPYSKRTANKSAIIAEIDHTIRYKKFKISRIESDIKKLKEDVL